MCFVGFIVIVLLFFFFWCTLQHGFFSTVRDYCALENVCALSVFSLWKTLTDRVLVSTRSVLRLTDGGERQVSVLGHCKFMLRCVGGFVAFRRDRSSCGLGCCGRLVSCQSVLFFIQTT